MTLRANYETLKAAISPAYRTDAIFFTKLPKSIQDDILSHHAYHELMGDLIGDDEVWSLILNPGTQPTDAIDTGLAYTVYGLKGQPPQIVVPCLITLADEQDAAYDTSFDVVGVTISDLPKAFS